MNTTPVLEVARLFVQTESLAEFEAAIQQAYAYLQRTEGYIRHELFHCLETPGEYVLLIHWQSLDCHLVNFRQSENYAVWRQLIGSFFTQLPEVLHYTSV